jgi:hypothetical protein
MKKTTQPKDMKNATVNEESVTTGATLPEPLSSDTKDAVAAMERVNTMRVVLKPYVLPSYQYVRCS